MSNKRTCLLAVCFAMLAIAFGTQSVRSQDKKPDAPAGGPSEAEMKKWMSYMMPGDPHKQLEQHFAGTWNAEVKSYMGGGEEVSTGSSENQMILGGRYLHQAYKGNMMGQAFEGVAMTCYDNGKKKFMGTWIDSMGTGLMVSEGSYDAATKTYTFTGDMPLPDGTDCKFREIIKVFDNDKHVFEMYMTGPDGKETKSLVITYTRKK